MARRREVSRTEALGLIAACPSIPDQIEDIDLAVAPSNPQTVLFEHAN